MSVALALAALGIGLTVGLTLLGSGHTLAGLLVVGVAGAALRWLLRGTNER